MNFLVSISQEDESLENSYGARSLTVAERARKFRAAHHTTADLRKLADKKITMHKLPAHHIQACAGTPGTTKNLRRLTSAAEKIDFLR